MSATQVISSPHPTSYKIWPLQLHNLDSQAVREPSRSRASLVTVPSVHPSFGCNHWATIVHHSLATCLIHRSLDRSVIASRGLYQSKSTLRAPATPQSATLRAHLARTARKEAFGADLGTGNRSDLDLDSLRGRVTTPRHALEGVGGRNRIFMVSFHDLK